MSDLAALRAEIEGLRLEDRAELEDVYRAQGPVGSWGLGYTQGWDAALEEALEILDRYAAEPPTPDVLAIVEDHWPQIGQDQSDSTWLYCDCGWDQSDPKAVSWFDHLEAAVAKARAKL
jgi:hypothetical protein